MNSARLQSISYYLCIFDECRFDLGLSFKLVLNGMHSKMCTNMATSLNNILHIVCIMSTTVIAQNIYNEIRVLGSWNNYRG